MPTCSSELKWLVRTFIPHMSCGISLEASVLPALAVASVLPPFPPHPPLAHRKDAADVFRESCAEPANSPSLCLMMQPSCSEDGLPTFDPGTSQQTRPSNSITTTLTSLASGMRAALTWAHSSARSSRLELMACALLGKRA